ncbi:exodeoxyribonuclease III [Cognatilysobacter terrigena]|uniref:exodeoxyribonuclease III n=1 Tax=Cognatilysobacter terrigena TaxID=2488749 RepID=UPI00105BAC50|nr:exodeoxyribonuclease III [Lysobacter terrigena]
MRVISFNANGWRSAAKKGFIDWMREKDADIVAVQETKAQEHQLRLPELIPPGYHANFRDATTKKGYSGVAIYSKREPDEVRTGLGRLDFDDEGRYIEARFGDLSVVSVYVPSGTSGDERQGFKESVMDWFAPILRDWLTNGRKYIVCGDWNIVRSRRDITNWTSNQKQTGCLPHERAWLNSLIADQHGDGSPCAGDLGWLDSFRVHKPDESAEYTWWSNRGQARANNVGWRIDYQLVTPNLRDAIRHCETHREPRFSDHAPYIVDYDYPEYAA